MMLIPAWTRWTGSKSWKKLMSSAEQLQNFGDVHNVYSNANIYHAVMEQISAES